MRSTLVTLCLLALTGCANLTATRETNISACTVWRPVSWSAKDTDQTIGEVKVNNARRGAYCERA